MDSKYLLLVVVFFLGITIFIPKLEGLETNIDEELSIQMKKNELVTKIQLNTLITRGDAWFNLGDITIRDKEGNEVNYGNNQDVQFGSGGNWYGQLPPSNLWDDSKTSMAHSNREAENLIIKLGSGSEIGSVQISNRQDCCWHRIGNYRMSFYNKNNEVIGYVNLDGTDYTGNPKSPKSPEKIVTLVGQGKTVKYNLVYPNA